MNGAAEGNCFPPLRQEKVAKMGHGDFGLVRAFAENVTWLRFSFRLVWGWSGRILPA